MVSTGWESARLVTNVPQPAVAPSEAWRSCSLGAGVDGAPETLPHAFCVRKLCPSTSFCRAILAWASALLVESTTPMSPMTLVSLLRRLSLVEQLPWTGGWGEVAWKQGWGRQGQDGGEGRRAAWQDDP